jgi:pyruvate/2-oxoglutarate dehydrogenase complex dihydrolipoamide acyltransferase (E2) component
MKFLDAKRSRRPIENKMGPGPSADKTNPSTSEKAPAGSAHPTGSETTGDRVPEREIKATPAAARLAEDNGVDLAIIQGTGADGYITVTDVRNAIERTRVADPDQDQES